MTDQIAYSVSTHDAAPEARKIHRKMFELVRRFQPGSVFEIGCGTGLLGAEIAASGVRYAGIEPEEGQFEVCRRSFPEVDVRMESCYADVTSLGLGLEKFDLVISNDVIEHL